MTETKVVKKTERSIKVGGKKITIVRLKETDGIVSGGSQQKSEVEIRLEEKQKEGGK